MSISKDKYTCTECDAFVGGEGMKGYCHLNPPNGKSSSGPDPYPEVTCDGRGCMQHSKRNKKK